MLTRRCTQRQFLLVPSDVVNQIVLYCLAVAATRYKITVHAFCWLSNHWHGVLSDPHGNRPEFCRWLHEFTAKCINAHRGRWENMWASEQYSAVELLDGASVLDKIGYVLANPVEAFLVACSHLWPGAISRLKDFGKTMVIARPDGFFRDEGEMPAYAELTIEKPAQFAELADDEWVELVRQEVKGREEKAREDARKNGRGFLGVKKVLAQDWRDCPATHEPRREISPTVAAGNKWLRIERLQHNGEFRVDHEEARLRFIAGDRRVEFPRGTYWMTKYAGAVCSPG